VQLTILQHKGFFFHSLMVMQTARDSLSFMYLEYPFYVESLLTPEIKRRIIHLLIQKVIVTNTGFELHYFAGMDQKKSGEALDSPVFSLNKKIVYRVRLSIKTRGMSDFVRI
jgi:hypothetical protein